MKGRATPYSDEELAWIEAHATLPRRELHAAFTARFDRPEVTQQNLTALCKRRGWLTGRDGRFRPGQPSHNAGKKGLRIPGSEKGWFRKGERRGVATRLYKPVGTERISKDGYVERKVNDSLPLQRRWRAVHLIRWEERHGPLPEGHCLKCLDGDKANTDPDNWICVPRALLPRLNGRFGRNYDTAPPELRPLILQIAWLEHVAREKMKERSK